MTTRPLLLGLAAAAIAGPALAQACLQPAEKRAVDLRTVQSQLMVAAIACGRQDDYNRFVVRFQRDLAGAYSTLGTYFRRAHGAAGQRQMDAYITTLANAQSQEGIRQGAQFCRNQEALWSAALAQTQVNAVPVLVQEHNIANPLGAAACPARQPATRAAQSQTPRQQTPAATTTRTAQAPTGTAQR